MLVIGVRSVVINPRVNPEIMFCEAAGTKIEAVWLTIIEFVKWYK